MAGRNPDISPCADEQENRVYVNVTACPVDKVPAASDTRCPSFTWSVLLPALCWLTPFVIISLRIYFTSVIVANNAMLTAEIQQMDNQNQLLEGKIKTMTAYNQNLRGQTRHLRRQIQWLQIVKSTLADELANMKKMTTEQNISRAQWSIDEYCPKKNNGRQCKPCQEDWVTTPTGCCALNTLPPPNQTTWYAARQFCKRKNSDLIIVANEADKTFVNDHSWDSSGNAGYWIGLRAEYGKWKWADGSDLTNTSWIQYPPLNGQCAISVQNEGWKSVNCNFKNRWICKKKALTL